MVRNLVLSDAIISVEPKGFNYRQLRTIELRLARVVVPSDKRVDLCPGKPSGMAQRQATATIKQGLLRMKTLTKNIHQSNSDNQIRVKVLDNCSKLCFNGVCDSSALIA